MLGRQQQGAQAVAGVDIIFQYPLGSAKAQKQQ